MDDIEEIFGFKLDRIEDGYKLCSSCSTIKPVSEFYPSKQTRDKLYGYCKDCGRIKNKISELKNNYGLSLESYNILLQTQNYKCKICLKDLDRGPNTVVDHCHKTMRIRGILCRGCNGKLAWFENYIENIKAYLG